jgi:hypothetical protein
MQIQNRVYGNKEPPPQTESKVKDLVPWRSKHHLLTDNTRCEPYLHTKLRFKLEYPDQVNGTNHIQS